MRRRSNPPPISIAAAIGAAKKERVAVIDFDQIEGQVTALGRFLAEEISTDLAGSPRPFKVIDRANLQSILAEHALSMSGLVNPENAKKLGQIAGVDALVLGTYTDFGESYRLSLKAIATDTAEMVATAKSNVPKTNALVHLAAEVVDQRGIELKGAGAACAWRTGWGYAAHSDVPPPGRFLFRGFQRSCQGRHTRRLVRRRCIGCCGEEFRQRIDQF